FWRGKNEKISKLLIAFSLVTTLSYASASTGFMNDNSHEAFAKSKKKKHKGNGNKHNCFPVGNSEFCTTP
ncbi:TPA: hypothetical protein OYY07_002850, partial [Staphylococcus aureus]|nr:hypothetical protein [Staphylococcus aureus]